MALMLKLALGTCACVSNIMMPWCAVLDDSNFLADNQFVKKLGLGHAVFDGQRSVFHSKCRNTKH